MEHGWEDGSQDQGLEDGDDGSAAGVWTRVEDLLRQSLSILAHKLGRAVYFMLKRDQAFDLQRFVGI